MEGPHQFISMVGDAITIIQGAVVALVAKVDRVKQALPPGTTGLIFTHLLRHTYSSIHNNRQK